MFSLKIPVNDTEVEGFAFYNCHSLRNVALALPQDAVIGRNPFIKESLDSSFSDLQLLFGSNARIIWELQHRFDELPIHSLVYYQSYHLRVLQNLIAAINMRSVQRRTLRSKLNPTGNQQDCLGMTPLHILTCSSVHNLELYCVIVEKYDSTVVCILGGCTY